MARPVLYNMQFAWFIFFFLPLTSDYLYTCNYLHCLQMYPFIIKNVLNEGNKNNNIVKYL